MTDAPPKPVVYELVHPDSAQVVKARPAQVETYASQGWRIRESDAPAGNASLEAWQDFARTKGFADDEIDGKTRDELRAALA